MSIETRLVALAPSFLKPVLRPMHRHVYRIVLMAHNLVGITLKSRDLDFHSRVASSTWGGQCVIWVRPESITFRFPADADAIRCLPAGFIKNGDWDMEHKVPRGEHKAVTELFVEGLPYHMCSQYQYMKTNMELGHYYNSYWCKTLEEIDRYFNRLIAAWEDMKRNGFRTQIELGQSGKDELGGFLDRGGNLLIWLGNHRLAMAELLGIPLVPFLVRGVHYEWVRGLQKQHGSNVRRAIDKGLASLNLANEQGDKAVKKPFL